MLTLPKDDTGNDAGFPVLGSKTCKILLVYRVSQKAGSPTFAESGPESVAV
jgi:hypothetical protein